MKRIVLAAAFFAGVLTSPAAPADGASAATQATRPAISAKNRPVRRDEPLREINISDIEVEEIESLMKERYPASIVYISPVTTGCPCEDGSLCTDQVWSIAQQNNRSYELALSRIDDKWQVGPLQQWWLTRDKILLEMRNWRELRAGQQERQERFQTYMDFLDRLAKHDEAYPVCTTD